MLRAMEYDPRKSPRPTNALQLQFSSNKIRITKMSANYVLLVQKLKFSMFTKTMFFHFYAMMYAENYIRMIGKKMNMVAVWFDSYNTSHASFCQSVKTY